MDLPVTGTGTLVGFNRHLAVPVEGEVHTGPRNPGDPVQDFASNFIRFEGELFGDPDFCEFRIRWGSYHGLPSPGRTTLTELPSGDFAIDSFFDITYQIDFAGCPGSQLDGYMGTTTDDIRLETGYTDGFPCRPNINETGCEISTTCADGNECQPSKVQFDPVTGDVRVLDCDCRLPDVCHVDWSQASTYGCVLPDNGTGTATLPPRGYDYTSPGDVFKIIDGLPLGTTIELEGILMDFLCTCGNSPCSACTLVLDPCECEITGGGLGGQAHCFEATLDLTVTGTGSLAGFNRHLAVPVNGEVHTGLRNPGDPVQDFASNFIRLDGELFGDPDFCEFRVRWGSYHGLPSPGRTTLTDVGGGNFAVDSFFDITYQIDFEGCPGSQLDAYAGTTEATIHIETGSEPVLPGCVGDCWPYSRPCLETVTENQDGTFDISCDCETPPCVPTLDLTACEPVPCPNEGYQCRPSCVNFDPNSGGVTVLDCQCRAADECYVDISGAPGFICVEPDNGNGTAELPPPGCGYPSPNEVWMIIDGLPPDTDIELDGPLTNFTNIVSVPGGGLAGERITFDAELPWAVSGTGSLAGFNRTIVMPVSGEMHIGPRTPGDPVQSFDTDMFRLQGEIFGDPDFCTLRFTASTEYGLPSPGHTTLYELPSGDFAIDSFFDISYSIEFEGCPGSQLDGYSGTTTATIHVDTGGEPVQPDCTDLCPSCMYCDKVTTINQDGTIDICCECFPDADLNGDGVVDFLDFAIMAYQWLRIGPP